MTLLKTGDRVAEFELPDQTGTARSLTALLADGPVVLFFYPAARTPGCTKEACAFRDAQAKLAKSGAVVLGVSPDDVASHAKFRDKYALNFPLLADPGHKVADKYGAWREKNMYGKKSMGVQRSTFLIDADGKVAKVWKRVSVDGHDEQVLAALAQLTGGAR